jgi:hypothetical protein
MQPVAGPSGHAGALHEDEDTRVEVEHPTAGIVIRMDETLHQRWKREFSDLSDGDTVMADGTGLGGEGADEWEGSEGLYHPFASELDWRVACWAVQEGIGHGSFDRLMSIPGVSSLEHSSLLNLSCSITLSLPCLSCY